jgi:hypothetical protein
MFLCSQNVDLRAIQQSSHPSAHKAEDGVNGWQL